MEQADTDDSIWSDVRRFADRHIQVCSRGLCLLAIPASLLFLMPSVLIATAASITTPVWLKATLSLTFLDKAGAVVGRQGPVAGQYVRMAQMPRYLPQAFMAMEDRRFYTHHGVDFLGLSRAAYTDLRARRVVAGGSTISQQTAKLLFTDGSRTFRRKLHELMNTAALEKSFSKNQILEIYLNRIYLGEGAFGVDTAARNYFGVPASKLDLPQAAMLAGLTRAPTVFSPRRNLAAAQKRAGLVLAEMVETGAITPVQASEAAAHPAAIIRAHHDDHSYVLDAAAGEVQKLVTENGIAARALTVQTTIDPALQVQAEDIVQRTVARLGPKQGFSQAALVLMTPDGSISSMVGGVDYNSSVFNRVTQAHRQPGSAFKPFVYLAALQHGISPWDWRDDQPVDIAGYQPANYQNASYGRLRLIDALARSVNTITVNLAQEVGLSNVASAARLLGIVSPLHDNASLALGTDEVTPLELTAAYAVFANSGKKATPHLISALRDADGRILFKQRETPQNSVMNDELRRQMIAMLCNVVEAGTGTAARLPGRDAGGKTGTTQEYRDAWFVGFTAGHVAGVWIGNDNNRPMRKVTGGTVPAQMWKTVMLAAEARTPAVTLDRSPGPPAGTEPEEVEVTAYTDDPMAGSAIVDAPPYRTPAVASAEPVPVIVSAPAISQTQEQPRPTQTAQGPTPPATPEAAITRVPYQAYVQNGQTPAMGPQAPQQSPPIQAYRPQPDAQYRPAEDAAEPDALYRQQREVEYRRVLREATAPIPADEAPYRQRDNEYRRIAPASPPKEDLPLPGPRERADRLD
jgi:penicillin-binding protein 1A